jgi:hypothetical protein
VIVTECTRDGQEVRQHFRYEATLADDGAVVGTQRHLGTIAGAVEDSSYQRTTSEWPTEIIGALDGL